MSTRFAQQHVGDSEQKAKITAVNISQNGNNYYHMSIFVTPGNNDIVRVKIGGIAILDEKGNIVENKSNILPDKTPYLSTNIGGDEGKKEYEVHFKLSCDDYNRLRRSRKVRIGIIADDGPVVMGIYQVKVKND